MRTKFLLLAALLVCVPATASARDIARRKVREDARIADGVATGALSPQEAGRLGAQENALDREEEAMRDANGGRLTIGQRRVLTRQQKRLSRRIFVQKHDGNAR
jgi:hypothetical protein